MLAVLLLTACTTHPVGPIGVGGRPFEAAGEEEALWARAKKEEEALGTRLRLLDDAALGSYLHAIAERLQPTEVSLAGGPGPRVVVVLDPTLNAFAMPNGWIYLHTGLLAALRSEAEVAVVLGRALAHVIHRDAFRVGRGGGAAGAVLEAPEIARRVESAVRAGVRREGADPVGAAVLGPTASVVLGLDLRIAATASMLGYPRGLEREADRAAVHLLVGAGYDPRRASGTFERLTQESSGRGPIEMFLLGQGAFLRTRVDSFRLVLRPMGTAAGGGAAEPVTSPPSARRNEFDRRMVPVVRENAALDVRAGRFTLAERQLDRVEAATPEDPIAQVYYGDLDRLRAQRAPTATERDELEARALRRYERAATLAPGLAEPYRQLGLLRYQRGDQAGARQAFERYLELRPDAPDAARVREYTLDLGR